MKQSPQISDIMSAAIPALRWPLILAAGLVLVVPSSPAQTAFIHDSSGNLTNVVSSSSASPTGIVPAIGQTVSLGDPLSLSVAGSGSGILAYQWRLNGNNISGATSATYFLGSASATDSGIYTVVITSSGGSVTNQVGTISVFPTTNSLYGIAYGSGKYIAVGDKGTIATSSDSYIWTLASSGTTNRLEALAFQGGKFVVVGEKGTILTSTNGTQWFPATSNNTNDFKGIAYGNGTYVVVGAKGTTLTSPDAIAWTTRSYDNPTLNGVAFAAGRFVLVGTSGSIWHSTNGALWLVRDWPTNVMLNAITYANSNYVAVGAKGVVLTSADANAWTQRAVTTSQDFESVVRFTDAFSEYVIAIGPPGAAFHSPNGTLWSASDSSTFEFLYGCVASNSLAVAVGRNGTIVRIPHWQTHHFEWASISSPQLVGQSFPVTVMAKDAADNLIYNNSGSASISAFSLAPASSNVLIGNVAHSTFATGTTNNNFTAGFSFTPRSDLTVTHVRHYFGGKISFWDENKNILAQLNVSNAPASWISTPLPDPLVLKAGKTYIIATYSQAGFYYRLDGSNTFSDGVLNQALIATIDAFPEAPYAAFWPLVDFSYSTRKSQQVSCSPSNIVFNGTMTQTNVTVNAAGDTIVLRVTDAAGHEGTSTPFSVYAGNTVGIVASASPSPASYQAPLVYSATLGNSGPQTATNVVVYDILPPGVTFVSANSSAGGCSVLNNVVECFIGNLTNKQTAWISVTVTPTVAGVVLTNTLQLNCSCQNFYPQYGGVQQLTYVPPRLIAANANVQEGNLGLGYVNGYPVTLSSTSTLAVRFSVSTAPVTAAENSDFVGLADRVFAVMPGSTTGYVTFGIQGDTIQESNETFLLKFSNPVNASLTTTQATITILNDDGIAGNVSSLSWNTLFSPKRINSAFAITNIARDSSNNIATNFSGNVLWRVANLSSSTNTLLTNDIHFASDNLGTYTLGYQFSVTTNLFVTHVRHYFGSKVSIWNDGGLLLASANVQGTPGEWSETQLSTPVFLQTNHFYRIGVYTAGEAYFWNIDSPEVDPDL